MAMASESGHGPGGGQLCLGAGAAAAALLLLACLLGAVGCRREGAESEPPADYFAWINPITGVRVDLPDGWRHNPDTATRGQTTVGYFAPNFSSLLRRYGHISLHYEYLQDPEAPMTLQELVDNFRAYMGHIARIQGEPDFGTEGPVHTARLRMHATHGSRELVLDVRFWTPDGSDFWYAVTESEADDAAFPGIAAPVVDLLVASTLQR